MQAGAGLISASPQADEAIDEYKKALTACQAAGADADQLNTYLRKPNHPLVVLTLTGADLATLSHRSYDSGFLSFCLRRGLGCQDGRQSCGLFQVNQH